MSYSILRKQNQLAGFQTIPTKRTCYGTNAKYTSSLMCRLQLLRLQLLGCNVRPSIIQYFYISFVQLKSAWLLPLLIIEYCIIIVNIQPHSYFMPHLQKKCTLPVSQSMPDLQMFLLLMHSAKRLCVTAVKRCFASLAYPPLALKKCMDSETNCMDVIGSWVLFSFHSRQGCITQYIKSCMEGKGYKVIKAAL